MSQSPAPAKTLPPVTLQDLMQALNATEANIRWWEGDGTLPKAERDPEGRLLWKVDDLRQWARSEAGQKFIARRV
jgi:DNA-binding transcriptional MerR regulator